MVILRMMKMVDEKDLTNEQEEYIENQAIEEHQEKKHNHISYDEKLTLLKKYLGEEIYVKALQDSLGKKELENYIDNHFNEINEKTEGVDENVS